MFISSIALGNHCSGLQVKYRGSTKVCQTSGGYSMAYFE
jgi:hypothetical protein